MYVDVQEAGIRKETILLFTNVKCDVLSQQKISRKTLESHSSRVTTVNCPMMRAVRDSIHSPPPKTKTINTRMYIYIVTFRENIEIVSCVTIDDKKGEKPRTVAR